MIKLDQKQAATLDRVLDIIATAVVMDYLWVHVFGQKPIIEAFEPFIALAGTLALGWLFYKHVNSKQVIKPTA